MENNAGREASSQGELELLDGMPEIRRRLVEAIGQRIVGQREVIELMLVALFARGHCLFVGVPGLAKTLLVNTTAQALGLASGRVQFTPDLMPADITGTEILEEDRSTGHRTLRFIRGPIFTNLLLADEINRTPPKTQAALLQAMQERKVTAAGQTYPLDPPFQVFATQNPIEQEGTYPLPEAELDRFMFSIYVDYPAEDEELEIVRRTTVEELSNIEPVLSREQLLAIQHLVRIVPPNRDAEKFAVKLARLSRPGGGAPDFVTRWVQWGAGPRASQYLVLGAKALAVMNGQEAVHVDDIRKVASAVLRHRMVLNFQAEAEGVQPRDVVARLLEAV